MNQNSKKIPQFGQKFDAETLLWILDHIYGNLLIADGAGNILFVNQSTADKLGYSREEAIHRNASYNIENGTMSRSTTLEAIQKKATVEGGFTSNTGMEYLSTSTPLLDDNGNVQLVLTYSQEKSRIKDLTDAVEKERKKAENYKYALQYNMDNKNQTNCIVTVSPKLIEILEFVKRIAKTDSVILINGESGTGKELIANFIKDNSLRKDEPFIQVNCAAIPANLMESEFFGYEGGAFTGANRNGKPGVFEIANNGTLFLDEIGELSLELQGKLLRILETSEFYRIGGTKATKVNIRLICATNRDLFEMVKKRLFRADLYYRINVIPCKIPPLRERKEDILPLTRHFVNICSKKYGLSRSFDSDLIKLLSNYSWPGNVRELRNIVERITLSSKEETVNINNLKENLAFAELEALFSNNNTDDSSKTAADGSSVDVTDKEIAASKYQRIEQKRLLNALLATKGNKSKAAKLLGISRGKLQRLSNKFNI